MNNYIVYDFYIVKTGEIFYVGQGKEGRNKKVGKGERSRAFDEVYNNNECKSRVLFSNLTQQQAWDLEIETIAKYRELGYPLVNISSGGCNAANGIDFSGEKNPMFGISPKERMDEETYKGWLHKQQTMDRKGEKNPNFGSTTLHEKYVANPEYAKQKQSRPGKQNGRCIPIALYKDGVFIARFDYKGECAQYLIDNNLVRAKTVGVIRDKITYCIKNNVDYCGYTFKQLEK